MDGGFPTSLIHSVAVVLLVIDVVHAATLFSVEDFPEGQFVNGELRSAQKGQSKVDHSVHGIFSCLRGGSTCFYS